MKIYNLTFLFLFLLSSTQCLCEAQEFVVKKLPCNCSEIHDDVRGQQSRV